MRLPFSAETSSPKITFDKELHFDLLLLRSLDFGVQIFPPPGPIPRSYILKNIPPLTYPRSTFWCSCEILWICRLCCTPWRFIVHIKELLVNLVFFFLIIIKLVFLGFLRHQKSLVGRPLVRKLSLIWTKKEFEVHVFAFTNSWCKKKMKVSYHKGFIDTIGVEICPDLSKASGKV